MLSNVNCFIVPGYGRVKLPDLTQRDFSVRWESRNFKADGDRRSLTALGGCIDKLHLNRIV